MSRKRAVQMVHLLVLVSGLGALPLLWCDIKTCVILIVQGLAVFLLLTVVQLASRHEAGSYQTLSRPDVLPDKAAGTDGASL